jgi:hypothetical protein
VTVEFDPEFHYPARLEVDPLRNVSDDERLLVARLQVIR